MIMNCYNHRWFHGSIGGQEAEKLLMGRGSSGSYLLRSSVSSPGDMVLQIRYKLNIVLYYCSQWRCLSTCMALNLLVLLSKSTDVVRLINGIKCIQCCTITG